LWPTLIVGNRDVSIGFHRLGVPFREEFRRDADGDELYFVHAGEGVLRTEYGPFDYRPGHYLLLPRGTTYRFEPSIPTDLLAIECSGGERYSLPDRGPLGHHAVYDPAVLDVPEPEAIEAFGKAVARGVDVRVLMPSTSGSDNPMVQHAGHRNFEKLLRCGVRLFEYSSTLLHQKVMTVDGVWCTVGSANFDDRSFEINDEITLGFKDATTAQRLDAIFEKYAPRCQELKLDAWHRRSWSHKLIDNMYYLFNEML